VAALLVGLAFAATPASLAQQAGNQYKLYVDGLACPFCAYGVEKQLGKLAGVERIDIEIGAGTLTLTLAEGAVLDEATARRAVEAAGFALQKVEPVGAE
jgi:mercuric ion binding protein